MAGVLAARKTSSFATRHHLRNALEYIDWRTSYKQKTSKPAGRNTAIVELKLLAMIMGEAVRLGHAGANPVRASRGTSPKPIGRRLRQD
jgi:hypothetical protein